MARKTVLVSDISGKEIEEGKGAEITVKYNDARRGQKVLDVTDDEADEVAKNGRTQARRGRKPRVMENGHDAQPGNGRRRGKSSSELGSELDERAS